MTCEHAFCAFPGSVARVFCVRCGLGREAFGAPVPARAPKSRARASRAQRAEQQPDLFAVDPDRDAAADIVAMRHLERELRARVDEAGLPEDEGEALIADALSFGPAIDLDAFAQDVQLRGQRLSPTFARQIAEDE